VFTYKYMYYAGQLARIRNRTKTLFKGKICSYKVYDEGILSLIDINGRVTDEVCKWKFVCNIQINFVMCR